MQSPGWPASINSMDAFRSRPKRALLVVTRMPSRTSVVQAVTGSASPSISTTQSLHSPWGGRSGWWHRCGM